MQEEVYEISVLLNIPPSVLSGLLQSRSVWAPQQLIHKFSVQSHKHLADSVTADLQPSSGINISIKTVHGELHGMGFHNQEAPVGVMYKSIKCTILI